MRYIRYHTNILVLRVYCDFEDEDAYYLVTEYVKGVSMLRLMDDQKAVVCGEIQDHFVMLKTFTSN